MIKILVNHRLFGFLYCIVFAFISSGCVTSDVSPTKNKIYDVIVEADAPPVDNKFFTDAAIDLSKKFLRDRLSNKKNFQVQLASTQKPNYKVVARIDLLQFDSSVGSINLINLQTATVNATGSIYLEKLRYRVTINLIQISEDSEIIIASGAGEGHASINREVTVSTLQKWQIEGATKQALNESRLLVAMDEGIDGALTMLNRRLKTL